MENKRYDIRPFISHGGCVFEKKKEKKIIVLCIMYGH